MRTRTFAVLATTLAVVRGGARRPLGELWEDGAVTGRAGRTKIAPMRAAAALPLALAALSVGTARSAETSPIDGVYAHTVTEADDVRYEGRAVAENYGRFVTIFARGHFFATQESPLACTWAYGTIQVKGNVLRQRFIDGGGIAPNRASNKPGEFFVWRWNLRGPALALTPISPRDLPTTRMRRLSRLPSKRYVNRRCPPPRQALTALGLA